MSYRIVVRGLMAAGSLSLLAACGGTQHIGEITPPVVQRLSGPWMLNVKESDNVAEVMRKAASERRGNGERGGARRPGGGGGMMPPGGGMTGGRGGGRMPQGGMTGGRPMGGGRTNPEAMGAMRRLIEATPAQLSVQLADSAVTLTYGDHREPWVLPFGKDVERPLNDDLKIKARAEWEEGRVVVTRSIDGGGSISEMYMPSMDGTRLTVDVLMRSGPGGGVEIHRIYDRPDRARSSGF